MRNKMKKKKKKKQKKGREKRKLELIITDHVVRFSIKGSCIKRRFYEPSSLPSSSFISSLDPQQDKSFKASVKLFKAKAWGRASFPSHSLLTRWLSAVRWSLLFKGTALNSS